MDDLKAEILHRLREAVDDGDLDAVGSAWEGNHLEVIGADGTAARLTLAAPVVRGFDEQARGEAQHTVTVHESGADHTRTLSN